MTYASVKAGIVDLMNDLGYKESPVIFDFEDASSEEYGNTFIILCESGKLKEVDAETLVDRFYDEQQWQIMFALKKTYENQSSTLDDMHRIRESIINRLDNSTNWKSYVRIQKYSTWEVEDKQSYILLTINFKVIDTHIYT